MGRWVMFLGLACGAVAQTADRAAEWIRSGEPVKEAWAAHWIMEQRLTSLVPELRRLLVEQPNPPADADAMKLAVLDALIQLKEPAPLADLEPLIDKFPTEVLILAARSQENNTALLLRLLERPHGLQALVAIGNLLAPRREPGFALRAMKEFCTVDEIFVYNQGQEQDTGMGWAGDSGPKLDSKRADWPETGSYTLAEGRPSGSELISDGSRPVSFQRKAGKTYVDHGFDSLSESPGHTACERAQEFLAIYLETDVSHLPLHADEMLNVTWAGDADYLAKVHAFFQAQRAAYAVMAQMLVARKYLSVSDAKDLRLNIRHFVSDARNRDRTTLPDIKSLLTDP